MKLMRNGVDQVNTIMLTSHQIGVIIIHPKATQSNRKGILKPSVQYDEKNFLATTAPVGNNIATIIRYDIAISTKVVIVISSYLSGLSLV